MPASVTIDRFLIVAQAPDDHPAPDRLRGILDRTDVRRLSERIKQAVGNFGSDDGRVIVLRRLDLSFAERSIDDPDELARQLAQGIAAALIRLSAAQPAETVAVFASAAERAAAFVTAISTGDAWGRWWFSDFESLKMLPASSAIRTALLRNPEILLEALAAVRDVDRARVAASLSRQDATLLVEALAPELQPNDDPQSWIEAFALPRTPSEWPVPAAIVHNLAVLAASGRHAVSRATISALSLRAEIDRAAEPERAAEAIRCGSVKSLAQTVPAIETATLARLLSLPPRARAEIAAALDSCEVTQTAPLFTPFGGIFLLWPHLPSVEPERLPPGPGRPDGLLAMLSLAALFGRSRSALTLQDSVVRSAFEIDQRATLNELVSWFAQLPGNLFAGQTKLVREASLPAIFSEQRPQHRMIRALGLSALADFALRLPGFGAASLPFLRDNLFGCGANVLVTPDIVRAVVDRPPLDVLLSISGLADRSVEVCPGRRLELERAS